MEVVIKNKRPVDCCNIPENMTVSYDGENQELETQLCKVCGRKHRRLIVEKAFFQMKMQEA